MKGKRNGEDGRKMAITDERRMNGERRRARNVRYSGGCNIQLIPLRCPVPNYSYIRKIGAYVHQSRPKEKTGIQYYILNPVT